MRKILLFTILFCVGFQLFSIVPAYHGARALSLGYAGSAFGYDINSIFINPSLLASYSYSLTGYQYKNSYLDYKDFADKLSSALDYNLSQFESLGTADKAALFAQLKDIFQAKTGIYGFVASVPGYVARGYGISISLVKTAVINPLDSGSLFDKDPSEVSNDDIESLEMNFLGLDYKQISLSYAFQFTQTMSIGATVHYLNGKITDFEAPITDSLFSKAMGASDYLETAWGAAEKKFNKVLFDLSASMNIGAYFKAALTAKNIGNPKLTTPSGRQITLKQRVIAGLALRPNPQWGIYLDMDIMKTDLLYNGKEMQPISFGIEKGFFENRFFVRAGLLSDLTEKHFFGKKSNALYGAGLGFNMKQFVVDVAIGLNSSGTVKSLAISGFILIKR
jgi:hypothetical protein